jgi:hypothetical protein
VTLACAVDQWWVKSQFFYIPKVDGSKLETKLKDRKTPQTIFSNNQKQKLKREEKQRRWWRIDKYKSCMWKSCVCEKIVMHEGERVVCKGVVCEEVVK